jgi:hypothetical protein
MLFAHLKRNLNFRRLRLRGFTGAHDECTLVVIAQNLRKLAKLVGFAQPPPASLCALSNISVYLVRPRATKSAARNAEEATKTTPFQNPTPRAMVIAHFAEATKPDVRPLPDAATQLLSDLVARRRQIIQMIVAERAAPAALFWQASAEEHRAASCGTRKGARRARPGH